MSVTGPGAWLGCLAHGSAVRCAENLAYRPPRRGFLVERTNSEILGAKLCKHGWAKRRVSTSGRFSFLLFAGSETGGAGRAATRIGSVDAVVQIATSSESGSCGMVLRRDVVPWPDMARRCLASQSEDECTFALAPSIADEDLVRVFSGSK